MVANLNSKEGRWFAEYHNVSKVTLLFFKPDGTKISSLNGEQEADFLRRVFDRVFKLKEVKYLSRALKECNHNQLSAERDQKSVLLYKSIPH